MQVSDSHFHGSILSIPTIIWDGVRFNGEMMIIHILIFVKHHLLSV